MNKLNKKGIRQIIRDVPRSYWEGVLKTIKSKEGRQRCKELIKEYNKK